MDMNWLGMVRVSSDLAKHSQDMRAPLEGLPIAESVLGLEGWEWFNGQQKFLKVSYKSTDAS